MKKSYYSKNKAIKQILFILIMLFVSRIGYIIISKEYITNINMKFLELSMPFFNIDDNNEAANKNSLNSLDLKTLLCDVLAINTNKFPIIGNEISFYDYEMDNDFISKETNKHIKQFQLNEDSIVQIEGDEIYDSNLKKTLDNSKPEVLIYHTHTSEAYVEAGVIDSNNEDHNIVGVGDTLEKELEDNYGISVIHDKTNHSVSYNSSYSRSNETLKYYLNKYGDFKIILDLHRDGLGVRNTKADSTININGINTAQIFFVNSKGSTKYTQQRSLTDFLSAKCNELYPGLLKKETIFSRGGLCKENLSASPNSLLIECGSQYNSINEAKEGAKIIARLIAESVNNKSK